MKKSKIDLIIMSIATPVVVGILAYNEIEMNILGKITISVLAALGGLYVSNLIIDNIKNKKEIQK